MRVCGPRPKRPEPPIGTHDLMMAATAQALGWSIWTHNTRDFARIPRYRYVRRLLSNRGPGWRVDGQPVSDCQFPGGGCAGRYELDSPIAERCQVANVAKTKAGAVA